MFHVESHTSDVDVEHVGNFEHVGILWLNSASSANVSIAMNFIFTFTKNICIYLTVIVIKFCKICNGFYSGGFYFYVYKMYLHLLEIYCD